ncbi:hypothetical protein N0V86_004112 [Didymella sp. IMI 355093]|nr:hypothetical protein N0V86_004112 [Didymella sp. IMI 355093]
MNILPWQFNGLGILSTIMFVFNLVLFTIFSLLAITRLFTFPRHVKSETLNQLEEISYQGAPAIAYLTLVAQVALTCSTAWGFRFTILAYVLWWIGLVWSVVLCSASVIVLAKRSITDDRSLSPAIFLPLIACMTVGTTGGIVTRYAVGLSVYTTGLINLSVALNSEVFRGFSAALLIFLVIIYLMNWGFTIWRLVTGVALGIPQQREEENEEAEKKAQEEHERLYGLSPRQREQREQEENQQNGQSA